MFRLVCRLYASRFVITKMIIIISELVNVLYKKRRDLNKSLDNSSGL